MGGVSARFVGYRREARIDREIPISTWQARMSRDGRARVIDETGRSGGGSRRVLVIMGRSVGAFKASHPPKGVWIPSGRLRPVGFTRRPPAIGPARTGPRPPYQRFLGRLAASRNRRRVRAGDVRWLQANTIIDCQGVGRDCLEVRVSRSRCYGPISIRNLQSC
jgi:hypothetical protein